jgi:hypothetical protein
MRFVVKYILRTRKLTRLKKKKLMLQTGKKLWFIGQHPSYKSNTKINNYYNSILKYFPHFSISIFDQLKRFCLLKINRLIEFKKLMAPRVKFLYFGNSVLDRHRKVQKLKRAYKKKVVYNKYCRKYFNFKRLKHLKNYLQKIKKKSVYK